MRAGRTGLPLRIGDGLLLPVQVRHFAGGKDREEATAASQFRAARSGARFSFCDVEFETGSQDHLARNSAIPPSQRCEGVMKFVACHTAAALRRPEKGAVAAGIGRD